MRRLLRLGLALLAATEFLLVSWTLLFPASFYATVPTVDLTPPFSEHLFRDFGGATLGLAIVLAAAVVWTETRLVVVALLAYLTFSVPHLLFHLGHLHGADGLTGTALVVLLTGWVVLPLTLLILTLRNSVTPEAVRRRDGSTPDRAAVR